LRSSKANDPWHSNVHLKKLNEHGKDLRIENILKGKEMEQKSQFTDDSEMRNKSC